MFQLPSTTYIGGEKEVMPLKQILKKLEVSLLVEFLNLINGFINHLIRLAGRQIMNQSIYQSIHHLINKSIFKSVTLSMKLTVQWNPSVKSLFSFDKCMLISLTCSWRTMLTFFFAYFIGYVLRSHWSWLHVYSWKIQM